MWKKFCSLLLNVLYAAFVDPKDSCQSVVCCSFFFFSHSLVHVCLNVYVCVRALLEAEWKVSTVKCVIPLDVARCKLAKFRAVTLTFLYETPNN